jgi:predicted transcriptional regulator
LGEPGRYPDDLILVPLDTENISRAFSPERVRLMRLVRDRGPFASVGELARSLGRDMTSVSRELGDLVAYGFVAVERHGKQKRVVYRDRPILLY